MKEKKTTSELRSRQKKQQKDTIKLLDEVRNDFMDSKTGGREGKKTRHGVGELHFFK